ncbi:MAG: ribonuclease HII [Pacificimonas sp.]|jgi:ribonuclease HII|nr:ribonuclease HII [Pacificimonas sp.]
MAADFKLEQGRPMPLAGVDEAGAGPLAGPVVAAAVILDPATAPSGLDDSKKLSLTRRETLFNALHDCAAIGIGIVQPAEIDEINILWARMLAMARAVEALLSPPAFCLVDGNRLPKWNRPSACLIGGDGLSASIAAASVIAKVTRDRMMADLDAAHPGYGWAKNKGYPTPDHKRALERLGPSPQHRMSFAPCRQAALAL